MLNVLRTQGRVFIQRLLVEHMVKGQKRIDRHAVAISTIPEPCKPYGKLIDNWKLPLYLEERDLRSTKSARNVFYKLFNDRVVGCKITPCDVRELKLMKKA